MIERAKLSIINQNNTEHSIEHSYDELLINHRKSYNQQIGNLKGYDCKLCKNRGDICVIENGDLIFKDCKCMSIRRSLNRIDKSGLRDLLEESKFENYIVSERWQHHIKEKAMNYINDNNKKWFFIGGQVGCGKTHLCTAIVGELLKKGKSAIYMPWKDDIVPLKAMVTDDEKYIKTISPLKLIDVLYIDDLFKTEKGKPPTTADINVAFEILNYRYNNPKLITLISSERLMDDIIDIDEALGSRIYQRTKEYCLNVGYDRAKNYRLKDA